MLRPWAAIPFPLPSTFCSCSLRNDQTSSDRFIRRDLSAFRGASRLSSPLSSITSNNDSLNADKRGKEQRSTKACYRSLCNCSDCRDGFGKNTIRVRFVRFSFKLSYHLYLYFQRAAIKIIILLTYQPNKHSSLNVKLVVRISFRKKKERKKNNIYEQILFQFPSNCTSTDGIDKLSIL